MQEKEKFIPPFPKPHKKKSSLFKVFTRGYSSWLDVVFEKSYKMKMGEFHFPKHKFFIASERNLIKRILEKEADKFPKHKLFHEALYPLIGDGVFTTNGEQWKNQRKMINPSFAHTNLNKVFCSMNQVAKNLVTKIKSQNLKHPQKVDPLMTFVTADIIFRTIFSKSLTEEEADKLYKAFEKYQMLAQRKMVFRIFGLWHNFYKKRVDKYGQEIREIFAPIVRERVEQYRSDKNDSKAEYNDVLASLLEARHPETKEPFSSKELVDQLAVIFLAGHETSATSLTWTLYLISKCPHMQKQIYQEIQSSLGKDGEITKESIKKLPILKNVFMESLRLYPPVSFFIREVTEQTCMRDKVMNEGDMLGVSPWLIHRNEDHWQDAHKFDPDRFDDDSQKESVKCSYLPFGKGPRTCIGAGFANQEAMIILANLIKHFEITDINEVEPKVISRLTTRPQYGIYLLFNDRSLKKSNSFNIKRNYCYLLKSYKYNRNIGCKIHDNAYGEFKGGGSELDRKQADRLLLEHMKSNNDPLAKITYFFVRLYGWIYFNYSGKPWKGVLYKKITGK
jgi:cytochrome P450